MVIVRVLVALGLLALGLMVGLASTVSHNAGVGGLLLAGGAPAALLVALPRGWSTRVAFSLGWAAVVAYGAQQRPEGDYLVSANVNGYVVLALALAQVLASVLTSVAPRPAAPRLGPDHPQGPESS